MNFLRTSLCSLLVCSSVFASEDKASIEMVELPEGYTAILRKLDEFDENFYSILKIVDPIIRYRQLRDYYTNVRVKYISECAELLAFLDKSKSSGSMGTDDTKQSSGEKHERSKQLSVIKNNLRKWSRQRDAVIIHMASALLEWKQRKSGGLDAKITDEDVFNVLHGDVFDKEIEDQSDEYTHKSELEEVDLRRTKTSY